MSRRHKFTNTTTLGFALVLPSAAGLASPPTQLTRAHTVNELVERRVS
jgi:hypothetical protein